MTEGYAILQWRWNDIFKEYYQDCDFYYDYKEADDIMNGFEVTDDIPCIELFTATMDKYGQYKLDDLIRVID